MNREQEYLAKIAALETDLKNRQHVKFSFKLSFIISSVTPYD